MDLNNESVDNFVRTVNIVHRTVNSTAGAVPSASDPFFVSNSRKSKKYFY